MEKTLKIIEAIGNQWPMVLVLAVITIIILKWKTIWNFVACITQIKFKRGQTELEFNKNNNSQIVEEIKTETISQEKSIESPKDLIEEKENNESSYYLALDEKDYKKAKKLFEKILDDEKDENVRKQKKLSNFYWRHINGDPTAFDELENYLKNIENDDEHKSSAYYYLSLFYSEGNNYSKSLELLKSSLTLAKTDLQKSICITEISEIHYKNGNEENSIKILLENIKLIKDRESLVRIYRSIAKYYKNTKNKLLESIAYQKAMELKPNDVNLIFDAAYNYSEIEPEFNDLGLLLYKKLLRFDSGQSNALNNIGVSYNRLGLNIKSIEYYKTAFEKGESLAASNLAKVLATSGFKVEAEEYLKKAQELKNIHDNVYETASLLKTKIRNEKENEEKILERADKKYLFFNSFANAAFSSEPIKIDKNKSWELNENSVKFTIEQNIITLNWEIGNEKHNMTGAILNNSMTLTYKKPKRNIYSYSEETKYSYTDYKGYGYFESNQCIYCFFEIDKNIEDFMIKSK